MSPAGSLHFFIGHTALSPLASHRHRHASDIGSNTVNPDNAPAAIWIGVFANRLVRVEPWLSEIPTPSHRQSPASCRNASNVDGNRESEH
jgi:hypothetical protein